MEDKELTPEEQLRQALKVKVEKVVKLNDLRVSLSEQLRLLEEPSKHGIIASERLAKALPDAHLAVKSLAVSVYYAELLKVENELNNLLV